METDKNINNWMFKEAVDQATDKKMDTIRMYKCQQTWKRRYREGCLSKEELDYLLLISGGEIRKV